MLATVHTNAIVGVDAVPIQVEVEVRKGKPYFTVIGLGDTAVRESRDRITSALRHSGFRIPEQILVNLAPAELKKEGGGFDLAIAVGILVASNQIPRKNLEATTFFGELSLDGNVRPVRGILALTINAAERGMENVVVPIANIREASLISAVNIIPITHLTQLAEENWKERQSSKYTPRQLSISESRSGIHDVIGQSIAKRASILAACGGHNLLFIGPPGCGKSMLAERFESLLPQLSSEEMRTAIRIHSIMGLPIENLLGGERPFRSPHHSVTEAGLVGGGSPPRPGEITLAHHGILFLDELPEFRRSALESLRGPLERGKVHVVRAKGRMSFPASFQLIAAMNPCPCGRRGNVINPCTCSTTTINNYVKKISQPILDRIDMHVELDPVPVEALLQGGRNVDTVIDTETDDPKLLRARIQKVQDRQLERFGKMNSQLSTEELAESVVLSTKSQSLLENACNRIGLSARGYFRVLRVARTVADWEESEEVSSRHIAEAISYRALDRLVS